MTTQSKPARDLAPGDVIRGKQAMHVERVSFVNVWPAGPTVRVTWTARNWAGDYLPAPHASDFPIGAVVAVAV